MFGVGVPFYQNNYAGIMRFFSNDDTRVYFAKISKKLKDEVERMSDVEITTCDFPEWVEYLYSKYMIVPVTI